MGEQVHLGHLKQRYTGEELWWHCFKEIRSSFCPLYLDCRICKSITLTFFHQPVSWLRALWQPKDVTFLYQWFLSKWKEDGPVIGKQSIFKAKRRTEKKYLYLSSIAGTRLLFKARGSEWMNSINYKWFSCVNRRRTLCCEDTEVSFLLFN